MQKYQLAKFGHAQKAKFRETWLLCTYQCNDQKHAKTNEIWRQNSEIHSAFACSHWPPWLPDLFKPYGACVKRGSGKHMFGLSLFRPSRQSNISTSGEERFKYPLPWENKISQIPYPRANKDNQNPTPCPAPPPPPRRLYIDRCITFAFPSPFFFRFSCLIFFSLAGHLVGFILVGNVFRKAFRILGLGERKGRWVVDRSGTRFIITCQFSDQC